MRKIIIAAIVFLSGCAVSHQTVMPSGQKGLSINCSGSAMSWNACYEKAGKQCPNGYDIVEKDGDSGNGSVAATGGWAVGGMASTRTMLVTCKP